MGKASWKRRIFGNNASITKILSKNISVLDNFLKSRIYSAPPEWWNDGMLE